MVQRGVTITKPLDKHVTEEKIQSIFFSFVSKFMNILDKCNGI